MKKKVGVIFPFNNNFRMLHHKEHVKSLLVFSLVLASCQTIKFTLSIPGLDRQCFYETLSDGQKYSIQTIPRNQPKYQIEVQNTVNGRTSSVYYKMAQMGYERMKVYKLANVGGTYGICFKNIQRDLLNMVVTFQTGVELLDFELLPDKSDAENLEIQVSYLEKYKSALYESISKVEETHASNMSSSQLLSTKMIFFAILGLVSIVVVNYLFFTEVKKTFRERKLI